MIQYLKINMEFQQFFVLKDAHFKYIKFGELKNILKIRQYAKQQYIQVI